MVFLCFYFSILVLPSVYFSAENKKQTNLSKDLSYTCGNNLFYKKMTRAVLRQRAKFHLVDMRPLNYRANFFFELAQFN